MEAQMLWGRKENNGRENSYSTEIVSIEMLYIPSVIGIFTVIVA